MPRSSMRGMTAEAVAFWLDIFKLLPDDGVLLTRRSRPTASGAARLRRHRGGTALARLQQFGGHCNGDCGGLLVRNACDANRAGHRCEACGGQAAVLDPPLERAPLGKRADQTEVRVV